MTNGLRKLWLLGMPMRSNSDHLMLLKTMFCPFTMDYGPDADTAQIAQTLSKTISKALMLIKYHVFNYLGQILVFILFPT